MSQAAEVGGAPKGLSRRDLYAQQTRQAVLDSAQSCFVALGYAHCSLEEVARRAQVTRGAVYHHFDSKARLFEEVFERQERINVERLVAATYGEDPAERASSSVTAFLDLCAQDPFRSIVMREGPLALGWPRWRELDQKYTLAVLEEQVLALSAAGRIAVSAGPVLVQLLYATLHEAARMVSEAPVERVPAIRAECVDTLLRMLAGLGPGGAATVRAV